MKVQRSIEINAPPEKVWPFLVEPEKIMQWYFPLRKFEYTGESRNSVGAPLYYEEKAGGMLIKLNCIVTECQENEVLAFKMTSGSVMKSYEERWTLKVIPSGSQFTFLEDGKLGLGIIGSIIDPLAQRSSAVTVNKMLARLKLLSEA